MNTKHFFVTLWGGSQEENYNFTSRDDAQGFFDKLTPGAVYDRFSHYPVFAELTALHLCPIKGLQSDMLNLRKIVA